MTYYIYIGNTKHGATEAPLQWALTQGYCLPIDVENDSARLEDNGDGSLYLTIDHNRKPDETLGKAQGRNAQRITIEFYPQNN